MASNIDNPLDQELENILNHPAPPYGDKSYWNERYENETDIFEWYLPFSSFKSELSIIPAVGVAVDIGCGTSDLVSDLIHFGFAKAIGIDYAEKAILLQKNRNHIDGTDFQVCDCSSTQFQPNYANVVFDKGTYDTLICSENGASSTLKEIKRILRPGGYYVMISLGSESTRRHILESEGFTVQKVIPFEHDSAKHFIYICQKPE